ncbi:MAG: ribonuclease [Tepidanaerobacteraceae bacterium]|nr:ribonuclease [Tepidanaerobacteraceae bacterium]
MSMKKEIVADVGKDEVMVGILEDGKLVEFFVERNVKGHLAGNIYKGKVANVLPGMQAAFVDIGLEKNAFLYVGDVNVESLGYFDEHSVEDLGKLSIQEILKPGQEILVQVVKEPMGSKGARVSTNITLAGRYLVLMPGLDYVGISRRIEKEEERVRLKALAEELRPYRMGVIVRTAAEGRAKDEIMAEMDYLKNLWDEIQREGQMPGAPRLIYKDMDLIERIVRDVFTPEVTCFYINTKEAFERVVKIVSMIAPGLKERVSLYNGGESIFQYFDITSEVEKALRRKVWLKSGGYIVIDRTEALTAIDVNTGRFTGNKDLEDTVLKTNLEAAKEIARQIRLRDIGGIIVIDFIDMNSQEHRKMVLDTLEMELKKDRTRTHILGITSLGLVEMTRKKVRQSLDEVLERVCPYCDGKGKIGILK